MVGQVLTVLAVGAGLDCSDILFLSPNIFLFFIPLSGMDGWVTCDSTEFFSDIRALDG